MNHAWIGNVTVGWSDADDVFVGPLLGPARVSDDVARAPDIVVRRGVVSHTGTGRPILVHNDVVVSVLDDGASVVTTSPRASIGVQDDGDIVVDLRPGFDRETLASIDLAIALALAMRRLGYHHLHAALLRLGDVVVALCARAEGGKSTTALALVAAGAQPWTDDATYLVAETPGVALATGLSRPLHVSTTTWSAFQPLLRGEPPSGRERSTVRMVRTFVSSAELAPIDGVVALEVVDARRSRFERVDEAETLGLLLESSVWAAQDRLPGTDRHIETLASVARGCIGIRAACGRDVLDAPTEFAAALLAAIRRA